MSEPIDLAALSLLRAIVADVEAGRAVVTRLAIHDDHLGQRADLAWSPPAAPEIMQARSISPPSGTPFPVPAPRDHTSSGPACTRCGKPAEVVLEEDGGGWFCAACDISDTG